MWWRCSDVGRMRSGVIAEEYSLTSLVTRHRRRIIRYRSSLLYVRVDAALLHLSRGRMAMVHWCESHFHLDGSSFLSFNDSRSHSENEILFQYHAKELAFITRERCQSSIPSEPAVIYSCLRSSR
jgi:hypothetical protein